MAQQMQQTARQTLRAIVGCVKFPDHSAPFNKYNIHSASLNELPPLRPVLRCLGTMEAARTSALLGWWQSSQTALLRMLLGECALFRSLLPSVRLWGRVFTRQALPSARSSTPSAVW